MRREKDKLICRVYAFFMLPHYPLVFVPIEFLCVMRGLNSSVFFFCFLRDVVFIHLTFSRASEIRPAGVDHSSEREIAVRPVSML